jgi:hypothetical protein
MEHFYLICAVLGGTVMIVQFVLTLIGLGGDHDASGDGHDVGAGDHDTGGDHHGHGHDDTHGSSWFFGVLTLRSMTAALAFFGLVGMGAYKSEIDEPLRFVLALIAGVAAMFLVAWVMRSLARLRSEGTVRIDRAIGSTATVYLTIPASKTGAGKVTVNVQNRLMEYQAVTAQSMELATGTKVVVVSVAGPETLEVASASS